MNNKLSKSSQKILFIAVTIIVFMLIGIISTNLAFMMDDHIYNGVHISNVSVGGLTVPEAKQKLDETLSSRLNNQITITYGKEKWQMSPKDIDMSLDTEVMAERAYQAGRTGNLFVRLKQRYDIINDGCFLPLAVYCNQEKLESYFADISRVINKTARKAKLETNGAKISIIPEVIGQQLDMPANVSQFVAQMNQNITFEFPLIVNQVIPTLTKQDLSDIDSLLTSFTTSFYSSTWNRSQNIILAAKSIDGMILKPGETFSFNQIVGERLPQFGYKKAPAYIDGELVDDWGGGVCQVSSTLYNAVLYANLDIVERSVHLRPAGYVQLGRDATVADGQIDFKFKNTLANNIYISVTVNAGQITVNIYGKGTSIQPQIRLITTNVTTIEPTTITKPDAKLLQGKTTLEREGQPGYIVTTYRVKYINGQQVDQERLSTDEYQAVDKIIKVGTKIDTVKANPSPDGGITINDPKSDNPIKQAPLTDPVPKTNP